MSKNVPGFGSAKGKMVFREPFTSLGDYPSREIPQGGVLEVVNLERIPFEVPLYLPDADPSALISAALSGFASRSEECPIVLVGDSRSSILKTVSLPSIERTRAEEVVQYELKKQIPFELSDTEARWMISDEEGSESHFFSWEVLLAAMKKDAVERLLQPLDAVGLRHRVDSLQFESLALIEYLTCITPNEAVTIALEMHAEYTNILFKHPKGLWMRNISIGGNHFTRHLAKDLKLTWVKAEALKLDPMNSDDPKIVFQSLRPVFNDLVTEVQRSNGFFKATHKNLQFERLFLFGGPSKLPGTQQYLAKNLGCEVSTLPLFDGIGLASEDLQPLWNKQFDNFVVPMTAAVQRLGYGSFRANFISGGTPFDLNGPEAWGVNIGKHGVTAVKVRCVS